MAVNLFDPNYYRSANPEVAGLSDEQAFQHFREVGLANPDPSLQPSIVENQEGDWPFSLFIDIGDLREYWRRNNLPGRTINNTFQPNAEQLGVAYDHLSTFGIAEGRQFSFSPTIYDDEFYRNAHPDLASLTPEQRFEHFRNVGLAEGRQASENFDVRFYLKNNLDLQQAGFDNQQALEHYRRFGGSGSRAGSLLELQRFWEEAGIFDIDFYRNTYQDLAGMSESQLFEHFRSIGLTEGRQASENFDVRFYLEYNPDLQLVGLDNQQALEHYRRFGGSGSRAGSLSELQRFWERDRVFDADFYRNTYQDLAGLSESQLFEHFRSVGLTQGRQASEEFDVRFYLEYNPDLQQAGLDNQQALEHYRRFGRSGSRRVASFQSLGVFDADFYQNSYQDLAGLSDSQLLEHFKNVGLAEGRQASEEFDVRFYVKNNLDLQQLGLTTNQQALEYYANLPSDFARRRSLKTLNQLWKELDVFDREFYRNRYPDLAGLSDRQLFEHFRDFGIQEGRTASTSFDAQFYLNNHPDLQQLNLNIREAIDHYISAGFEELRQGAPIAPEVVPNNTPETALLLPLVGSSIRRPNRSVVFGSVSPDDPVDFYSLNSDRSRLGFESGTFELKGLTDNVDLKIVEVRTDRVTGTVETLVLAESASTGTLAEQVVFDRPNIGFSNYYLVVEAAADLENRTNYALPFSYRLQTPPTPPPVSPAPSNPSFSPDDEQTMALRLAPNPGVLPPVSPHSGVLPPEIAHSGVLPPVFPHPSIMDL